MIQHSTHRSLPKLGFFENEIRLFFHEVNGMKSVDAIYLFRNMNKSQLIQTINIYFFYFITNICIFP